MILSEGYINYLLRTAIMESVDEEDNPYYQSQNSKDPDLSALWKDIQDEQLKLEREAFGDIYGELDELTKAKIGIMGEEHVHVPRMMFTAGNAKLPMNVLVVNITSAMACPSYWLGMCQVCQGACYAQRDENRLDNVRNRAYKTDILNTRLMQLYKQGHTEPMERYFNLVEMYIRIGERAAEIEYQKEIDKIFKTYRTKDQASIPNFDILSEQARRNAELFKIKHIRINESGDFPCAESYKLWTDFAAKMKKKYGINTHTYTARQDIGIVNPTKDNPIAVNASRDDIGGEGRRFLVVSKALYDRIPECNSVDGQPKLRVDKNGRYYYKCPCGNEEDGACGFCGVCFEHNKTGKNFIIYACEHGNAAKQGMMNMFTNDEIRNTLELSVKNGYITKETAKKFLNKPANQRNHDAFSEKVRNKRKEAEEPNRKKKSKK